MLFYNNNELRYEFSSSTFLLCNFVTIERNIWTKIINNITIEVILRNNIIIEFSYTIFCAASSLMLPVCQSKKGGFEWMESSLLRHTRYTHSSNQISKPTVSPLGFSRYQLLVTHVSIDANLN